MDFGDFFEGVGRGPSTSRWDFGGNPLSSSPILPQFLSLPQCSETRFLRKPIPLVFWGVLLGFGLCWIFIFLFEWSVGKLVGWFSSSTKLLFRFTSTFASTSDYLKVCKFITYLLLEAVNMKKYLIITGTTNSNWNKFGAGFFAVFFQRVLPVF